MKKQNKIISQGFTLVELMVVIAMVGIMSAVTIASLHNLKTKARLKSAQSEIAIAIKTAQSYALQGKKQQGGNTVCGYGFRFKNSNNYEIFYNEKSVSGGCVGLHYGSYSKVILDRKLVTGVKLEAPSFNQTQIFFTLPHANAYNYKGAPFLGSTFVFRSGTNNKKQIVISKQILITNN